MSELLLLDPKDALETSPMLIKKKLYETGVHTRAELKTFAQSEVTTYLGRALPLCIILSQDVMLPWYYQHFIQVCTQVWDDGYVLADYQEPCHFFMDVMDTREAGYDNLTEINNIVSYVVEQIDHSYYVSICLDEFYLKTKNHYMNTHYVHENMIYGYDHVKEKFLAMGFSASGMFESYYIDYETLQKAYDDGKLYYKDSAPYANTAAIRSMRLRQFKYYLYDITKFLNELSNYITSWGDPTRMNYMFVPAENGMVRKPLKDETKYGIEANYLVLDRLERMLKGELLVDYRSIHLLAEHKKGLYARCQFAIEKNELQNVLLSNAVQQYEEIVNDFELIRLKAYKASHAKDVSSRVNALNQIVAKMRSSLEKEQTLLKEIYQLFSGVKSTRVS